MAKTDPGIGFCTQATPRAHRPSRRARRQTRHAGPATHRLSPSWSLRARARHLPFRRRAQGPNVPSQGPASPAQRHAQGHRVAAHQGRSLPGRRGSPAQVLAPARNRTGRPGVSRCTLCHRAAPFAVCPCLPKPTETPFCQAPLVRSVRRTQTRFIRRVGHAPADSSALIDQSTRGWPSKHCHSPCGSRPRCRRRFRRLPAGADPGAGRERSAAPERTRRSGRSPSARRAARHGGPRHDPGLRSLPRLSESAREREADPGRGTERERIGERRTGRDHQQGGPRGAWARERSPLLRWSAGTTTRRRPGAGYPEPRRPRVGTWRQPTRALLPAIPAPRRARAPRTRRGTTSRPACGIRRSCRRPGGGRVGNPDRTAEIEPVTELRGSANLRSTPGARRAPPGNGRWSVGGRASDQDRPPRLGLRDVLPTPPTAAPSTGTATCSAPGGPFFTEGERAGCARRAGRAARRGDRNGPPRRRGYGKVRDPDHLRRPWPADDVGQLGVESTVRPVDQPAGFCGHAPGSTEASARCRDGDRDGVATSAPCRPTPRRRPEPWSLRANAVQGGNAARRERQPSRDQTRGSALATIPAMPSDATVSPTTRVVGLCRDSLTRAGRGAPHRERQ